MTTRLKLFTLLIILAFLLVIIRLFYWQVYKGRDLSIQARGQYQVAETIDAQRGDILANDGSWLAAGQEAWLVYASLPDLDEDSERIAERLAPYFIEDESEEEKEKNILNETYRLQGLLEKDDVVWVPLKNRVSLETKKEIEALEISGIGFESEEVRAYPEASTAAQLLGFVGKDENGHDKGYFGLEGYYDVALEGKVGYVDREKDASGIPLLLGASREVSAVSGVDLQTHIDKAIQFSIEEALKKGIERYGASAGVVAVMEPSTGSILGMTAYPSYDPLNYWEFSDELFNNPVISSTFEPGSVFKVLVMASALDAGVVRPETKCDICSGPAKVDKYFIETWNQVYHPESTMTEVIVHSDNVGMVFVGKKLGSEKMYDYLNSFGIGKKTGIDLQGEATAVLREKGTWSTVDLATASFGQGVAVTPIQMLRAVSAIANKGVIMTPQVVDKIIGNGWEEDTQPSVGKRVISEKAAGEITAMMAEAAKSGESKWTHLAGFKVAGKTGTAQIPIAGHYDDERTIASFVGFAPYDDPKFVMLVTLSEPSSSPWASETAAPLWYSVANDLFIHFGIQPEN